MVGKIERYILEELARKKGLLFAFIDPLDYRTPADAVRTARNADQADADVILVGGSTGVQGEALDSIVKEIKGTVSKPVVLFPGNIGTVTRYADALYFMSLLNSRNPYWISEAQVLAAPMVRAYHIEPLPVAYVVVEPGGTVGWVGDARFIPRDKPKLAAAFGMAAECMGFRFFITDTGSGPVQGHIPLEMVRAVRSAITIPYIVAGGVRTPDEARAVVSAGADVVQIGTAFEREGSVEAIKAMVAAVRDGAMSR